MDWDRKGIVDPDTHQLCKAELTGRVAISAVPEVSA